MDFAAVTDHAEYMGQGQLANLETPITTQPLAELLNEENHSSMGIVKSVN
ncbi:MAG: hypothetical protein ACJAYG_002499 [Oceanicoccus sp.]